MGYWSLIFVGVASLIFINGPQGDTTKIDTRCSFPEACKKNFLIRHRIGFLRKPSQEKTTFGRTDYLRKPIC